MILTMTPATLLVTLILMTGLYAEINTQSLTPTKSSEAGGKGQGVTLTLNRKVLFPEERGNTCGQLTCQARGDHVTIDRVTIKRIKTTGEATELLELTTSKSENQIFVDEIRGNGTLRNNAADVQFKLSEQNACDTDHFTCELTFTKKSGEKGNAYTMTGLEKSSNPQIQPEPTQKTPAKIEAHKAPSYTNGNPYTSELWFLGDKITKIEGKFETLSDRLEARVNQKVDAIHKRAGTLENSVLERVSSVESDFSSRVSRLEDRVSSRLLSEPESDTGSELRQSLADLERRVTDLATSLEKLNESTEASRGDKPEEAKMNQTGTCDSGMGDDVTKSYPPYVIMSHPLIKKTILCDTHTVGGGWIVIQRRAKGDVDFYLDWSAYRQGFGSPTGDFWLGNEAIYQLTNQHPYELRIDIRDKGQEMYSEYSTFKLESEADLYRLRLGSYSGNAGDAAMSYHNNQPFSTFDRDNDSNSGNCARDFHGAWWYNNCHHSNLNGMWALRNSKGVRWYSGSSNSFATFTEMKIRRVHESS